MLIPYTLYMTVLCFNKYCRIIVHTIIQDIEVLKYYISCISSLTKV